MTDDVKWRFAPPDRNGHWAWRLNILSPVFMAHRYTIVHRYSDGELQGSTDVVWIYADTRPDGPGQYIHNPETVPGEWALLLAAPLSMERIIDRPPENSSMVRANASCCRCSTLERFLTFLFPTTKDQQHD